MYMSSILFLVWFLPICWGVSFLLRKRSFQVQNTWLLTASLFFYGWNAPWWLLLIGFDVLVSFGSAKWMERLEVTGQAKKRTAVFAVCLIAVIALLFFFKYWNFFAIQIEQLSGLDLVVKQIVLPAGISFYTFQVISYLADVYTHKAPVQNSLLKYSLYICMFFQLVAGPIVRYTQIESELGRRALSSRDYASGAKRFLCGLSKKVLIANPLFDLYMAYRSCAHPSVLYAWIAAVGITLMIYFDFSGYSDMAIGLGRLWGFHLPENFDYPILSKTFTGFWRRWHLTLTQWFRDYVYIPLGGSRKGIWIQIRNLLAVWLLTGFWHGASWTFVCWGLLFFLLLVFEKFLLPASIRNSLLYAWTVRIVLVLSFVLFYDSTLSEFAADLGMLFAQAGLPFSNLETLYVLRSSAMLLIAAFIGSTPLPARLARKMEEKAAGRLALQAAAWIGLILCLASLVTKTGNPFLYFQF